MQNRQSVRLPHFDYAASACYFITICTDNRLPLLGSVDEGLVRLSAAGRIAANCWLAIPQHFAHAHLDEFVIMPNHLHGILLLDGAAGGTCSAPTTRSFGDVGKGSLPSVIRQFKAAVTKEIRQSINEASLVVWQRSYYEHVLRNDKALALAREYIANNPVQWELDKLEPVRFTEED